MIWYLALHLYRGRGKLLGTCIRCGYTAEPVGKAKEAILKLARRLGYRFSVI